MLSGKSDPLYYFLRADSVAAALRIEDDMRYYCFTPLNALKDSLRTACTRTTSFVVNLVDAVLMIEIRLTYYGRWMQALHSHRFKALYFGSSS